LTSAIRIGPKAARIRLRWFAADLDGAGLVDRVALEPRVAPRVDRHLRGGRVDVRAGDDRRGDLVEPLLPVALPVEVADVLLLRGVAVAGSPLAGRQLLH
jgi:hypothetical protein